MMVSVTDDLILALVASIAALSRIAVSQKNNVSSSTLKARNAGCKHAIQ